VLRLALACLLARGHLLIEDVPAWENNSGAGAGAERAVKFSPFAVHLRHAAFGRAGRDDLQRAHRGIRVQAGPIFTNFLLADEINRATPKTQSALLEAMNEQQ